MFGLLVTYFFILLLRTVSSQTVSLQYVDAYKNQRVCAGACQAVNIGSTPDLIAEAASCNINPIENSCFCKVDLQASVENHISTCVAKMCSNTNDAVTATSIYNDYCSSAGFVKAVATTGAGTTTGTKGAGPSATSTNTQSTDAGSPNDSNSGSSGSKTFGGLSESELIGIIVGIVGVIVSGIGAYYTWKALKK